MKPGALRPPQGPTTQRDIVPVEVRGSTLIMDESEPTGDTLADYMDEHEGALTDTSDLEVEFPPPPSHRASTEHELSYDGGEVEEAEQSATSEVSEVEVPSSSEQVMSLLSDGTTVAEIVFSNSSKAEEMGLTAEAQQEVRELVVIAQELMKARSRLELAQDSRQAFDQAVSIQYDSWRERYGVLMNSIDAANRSMAQPAELKKSIQDLIRIIMLEQNGVEETMTSLRRIDGSIEDQRGVGFSKWEREAIEYVEQKLQSCEGQTEQVKLDLKDEVRGEERRDSLHNVSLAIEDAISAQRAIRERLHEALTALRMAEQKSEELGYTQNTYELDETRRLIKLHLQRNFSDYLNEANSFHSRIKQL